ncbi:hypothetical protein HZA96_04335 [Candidatus Woesearchaeota archaeon]|nr:hypothetical protein [Candidatus Woesearchaeota archaeon]
MKHENVLKGVSLNIQVRNTRPDGSLIGAYDEKRIEEVFKINLSVFKVVEIGYSFFAEGVRVSDDHIQVQYIAGIVRQPDGTYLITDNARSGEGRKLLNPIFWNIKDIEIYKPL